MQAKDASIMLPGMQTMKNTQSDIPTSASFYHYFLLYQLWKWTNAIILEQQFLSLQLRNPWNNIQVSGNPQTIIRYIYTSQYISSDSCRYNIRNVTLLVSLYEKLQW